MARPQLIYTDKPHGDRGPKIKRPPLPEGDFDVAVLAQIMNLLVACAVMAKPPACAVWWTDERSENVAEAEAAIRALVASNKKLLHIDEASPAALYLTREGDFVNLATIYRTERAV